LQLPGLSKSSLSELRVGRQRTKITLRLEELQLKAWDIAVAMKQRSTPTGTDVRRAVRRLTGPKVDMSTDPAFRGYRRHFLRINTELATATKRMPDLAAFLEVCSSSPHFSLHHILSVLIKALALEPTKEPEEIIYWKSHFQAAAAISLITNWGKANYGRQLCPSLQA
jgi:hypothetical protein